MLGLSVNHQTKAVLIFEFHQPSLSKRSLVHKLVQNRPGAIPYMWKEEKGRWATRTWPINSLQTHPNKGFFWGYPCPNYINNWFLSIFGVCEQLYFMGPLSVSSAFYTSKIQLVLVVIRKHWKKLSDQYLEAFAIAGCCSLNDFEENNDKKNNNVIIIKIFAGL